MPTPSDHPNLLDALEIDELSTEEQEELLLELDDVVTRGAMLRIIEGMDEREKAAFDTFLDTDPEPEELQAFMDENVPHAEQSVRDTVQELTDDILAVTGESQN